MALQPNNKQIDNSTIPLAARRAGEEADRLQRESIGAPEPGSEGPQEPVEGAPPPPAPDPAPAPPEPSEGAGGASQTHEPDPNDQTWEQRAKSELGRNRKLREDLQATTNRIDELQRLLATVQTATAAPAQQPSEMQFEKLITDEDREQWGEVLPVIEKRAKELIAPLEAALNGKIKELDERLKGVGVAQQQDSYSRMLQVLDSHPLIGVQQDQNSWRLVNDDEDFYGWLQFFDRHSGRKRHELLKEAYSSHDASRVAAFFEDYLKESGRTAPQSAPGNGAAPTAPKPSLESFAAPGKPRSAPARERVPADKPIITTGDIARFFADKRNGRFNTPQLEQWAKDFERDMFAAQAENRVRPGPPSP